jgi:hypothetical protein
MVDDSSNAKVLVHSTSPSVHGWLRRCPQPAGKTGGGTSGDWASCYALTEETTSCADDAGLKTILCSRFQCSLIQTAIRIVVEFFSTVACIRFQCSLVFVLVVLDGLVVKLV